MRFNNLIKYALRFIFLQGFLSYFIVFYFDNFLISSQDFKQAIYQNLVQDANRFLPFVNIEFISVDAFLTVMVFSF